LEKAALSGAKTVKLSDPFSKSVRLALSNKLANVERLESDDATCGILLGVVVGVAVGVAVDVLDVVQPDTNREATTNNRTAIAVIDFSCITFMQVAKSNLTIPISNEKYQLNRMC
jgi:hypothetical protein